MIFHTPPDKLTVSCGKSTVFHLRPGTSGGEAAKRWPAKVTKLPLNH
jgi:hypothetical protein